MNASIHTKHMVY
jgi:prephenate dehydrogenase (NADP+)